MSEVAIHVEDLGKLYRIGELQKYKALRDTLSHALYAPFQAAVSLLNGQNGYQSTGSSRPSKNHFWALKEVSFEVKKGEAIGIIGRNGAGKSTLLKILSRITKPTKGYVRLHGRVGSLLEVGTGFHPELTGRENIYLNGAIIGMRKKEIDRKFDEIVAFAEIEKFIDTPIKLYSSGMYIRLAFAVAAHLEPEILLIDEVLAVGDAQFQKKCLGKMEDVAKQGRTVLFVSHNMQAIMSLCSRAILLNANTIEKTGVVDAVVNSYLTSVLATMPETRERVWDHIGSAPGNEKFRVHRIAIIPNGTDPNSIIEMRTPFRVEVEYWNLVRDTNIIVMLCLYALDGSPVFESHFAEGSSWKSIALPKGLFRTACFIPGDLLNEGTYRLQLVFVNEQIVKLFDFSEAAKISVSEVVPRNIPYNPRYYGNVHPLLSWRTEMLEGLE
jgi:lipopolysaccharide transport system ATP-binding protein